MKTTTIYLLHFNEAIHHAGHYICSTANLDERLEAHRKGSGARLMAVLRERGIGFVLARTWSGDKQKERAIKKFRNGRALCPICSPSKRWGRKFD